MIVLDTDTCIEILRGNQKVLRRRNEHLPDEMAISFMTVAELFYGAEKALDPIESRVVVERLLLSFTVVHSETSILKRFGSIKSTLKRSGGLIPDADLLVAATALEKAECLVTGNSKHFERIEGLKLENWIR